jgi:hypothetical protein
MAILTKAQLKAENSSSFPNNNSQAITPQILRDYNVDIIDTLVDSNSTASFARTDLTNEFSATNNFTSISASSFVSASEFVGDGSKLTNITASIAIPISDEGILQGYATQLNFSGSNISASLQAGIATISVNTNNLVTTSSFNSYTSSNDSKVNSLISATASYANSASVAAVDAAQQSQINSLIASTSSFALTSLNAFTASQETKDATLGLYTASVDEKFTNIGAQSSSWDNTNLNSFTASQNTKNSTLATYTASVDTKFATLGTQSGSWITESETGSFVTTNTTQTITAGKTFQASIGMSSGTVIQFGGFATNQITSVGGGRNVTVSATETDGGNSVNITAGNGNSQPNNTITLLTDGSSDTNKITLQSANIIITGSADISGNLTASLSNGYVWVGNSNNRTSLVATSSFATSVSGFVTTASFNSYTQSNDQRVSSLEAATSSYVTESETASFARTNVDNNFTANQTFTNITAVSASFQYVQTTYETASVIYSSGSNQFGDELSDIQTLSGSVKVQGSLTVNGTPVLTSSVDISGLTTTASFNAYTQSNDSKVNSLINATASYATSAITASSVVTASAVGNTITFTKGDASTFDVSVVAAPIDTGSFVTTSSFNSYTSSNNQRVSSLETATASLFTSTSLALYTASFDNGTRNLTFTKGDNQTFSVNIPDVSGSTLPSGVISGSAQITALGFVSSSVTASSLVTASFSGNTLTFTKGDASTFGIVLPDVSGSSGTFATLGANTFTGSQTISSSLNVSGSANFVGGDVNFTDQGRNINIDVDRTIIKGQKPTLISQSLDIQNTLTASLANGFTYVGNGSNRTTLVATSSFATNVSNLATTGSNSFVGNQTITGSLILSSSNAIELTVIGNSVFTGSAFGNVVALSITANTASMDLSRGNYFTLTLADTATTHISASNVQPGVSATLVITTGTNSSASLAPTMLQPSGSAYSATNGSAKKDVLSIVAVASNVPFVVSTKNMI